ncbi:MAG TPA: hypothetical protein IAA56_06725 [Candidatus Galloscillospira excrementavium]|nr:hypothetical protein [Candidatus Galloscillospira excrementavium]
MKQHPFWRRGEFWLSAGGLAVLTAVFLVWYRSKEVSGPGLAAALCSAGLFAAVCLRFVPEWLAFWRRERAGQAALPISGGKSEPRYIEGKIFLSLLLVEAAVVLAVYLLRRRAGYQGSFVEGLSFWTCTDSGHYLDIARDWYLSEGEWDRLVQLVFLPGYPLAVRLVDLLVGNLLYSGMLVSALSFAGAGCVLYRLFWLDCPHGDALRAVRWFCLLPGGFFFAAPMSESLFLLLCAACLYCARTERWTLGCALGGLAAFTRSLGLTLLVPLFFELVSRAVRRRERPISPGRLAGRGAALLLIPAGFGIYCWVNYLVAGNPFQFMEYQRLHWSQQLGWFFNTAAYQTDLAIQCWGNNLHNLLGLWLPNLLATFSSLIVMLLAVKKLRPSYTAWYLAYFVVAIGATWLLSAPRYLIALIPLPLSLARLTRRPAVDALVSLVSGLLYLLYLYAFVMRWQVW